MTDDLLHPALKNEKINYALSIAIIGAFFFIFGFVTWLNGVLIPYLRIACELNYFQAYFVAFAFYISYFVMAIPSAWVLKHTGFKSGMALGLYIMAAGALIFIPAALTRTYGLFLTGLFVMGTGLAILQTASNPYITILGPRESAAKRISIMGICNKVAGVISPLILGIIVLKDANIFTEQLKTLDPIHKSLLLDTLASRVILPYIIMAVVLTGLGLMVRFTSLPDIDTDHEDEALTAANAGKSHIFHFPHLILGVITLFLYVGVEVIAGDTIIPYGLSQGIPLSAAKVFTSYTLTAMVIGYIFGIILIPKYIKQENSLGISAVLGVLFSILAIFSSGMHYQSSMNIQLPGFSLVLPFELSVFFIALLGFANAIMWPAIWPLAIHGLGRFTKIGSSLLIMAIAGGALLPLLYGRLADKLSPHHAYWITIPCYIVIFYYAFFGHKIRSWK
ncbi:MAG: sugar MFS transporter [Bacteroidetes bacterium]|nr:sugar MFS transporter [Bacteroidota bacterium]